MVGDSPLPNEHPSDDVSALFAERDDPATAYYLPICIQGVRTDALVDTGASITLMSDEYFKAIPNLKMDSSPPFSVEGVIAGSQLDVLGQVNLPIKVGKFISKPHPIVIVKGASQLCLLGMDFLDRFHVSIDVTNRCVLVPSPSGEVEVVRVKILNYSQLHKVVAATKFEIPPRSALHVKVQVKDCDVDIDGCIEGLEKESPSYLVPRSLHALRDGATFIDCVNITDSKVLVQKGQALGNFSALSINPEPSTPEFQTNSDCPSDVNSLFDLSSTDLTEEQKEVVYQFLDDHRNVIGTSDFDMGLTDTVEHRIELENSTPVKQPYRRFPAPLQKEIQAEISKLLKTGVIEPSHSSWASPLVPVRKRNGKLRMCIDYRQVNSQTKKDSFPLPNLSDAVSKFKDNKYFSSLDLLSGYHQISVETNSREITAFSDGQNLYQYARMPFGVTNGPASFSRLVAVVLSGIPFDIAQAYLDDIIVSGRDFEDHLSNLELVFSRLSMHGLKLSAQKCSLFRSEVEYLGHLVGREGIKPLGNNIKAVMEYPVPTTVKQLRSFNGMVNFYKKFIHHSETIMKPLYRATAARKLVWSAECETAFGEVKKALTEAPVLSYPDFSEHCKFIVTCDASSTGSGAVLSQLQSGDEKVLAYAGTSFNEAQTRYSTTDRELAAIRFAVNHFKPYLYGRRFVIRTDHEPLIYLYQMKRFDDRLHRTLEDLHIGQFELEYLPGRSNVVADALSRANYPWELPDDDTRFCWEGEGTLDNFDVIRVDGGGDSFFEAWSLLVDDDGETPVEVRENMVTKLMKHPEKYGYTNNASGRKSIQLLRSTSIFPPFKAIKAVADQMPCNLVIHFESGPTFSVKSEVETCQVYHLLCCGGVHFNVLKPNSNVQPSSPPRVQVVHPGADTCKEIKVALNSSVSEIKMSQHLDINISELIDIVRHGNGNDMSNDLKAFGPKFARLSIDSRGLLVFEAFPDQFVPVVPDYTLKSLANELHEVLSHSGRDKTVSVMYSKFHNPHFPKIISQIVKECEVCQKHKGYPSKRHPVYRRVARTPFEMYAVDLMDLPKSKRGFKCVLTGIDLCTKFAHVIPLRCKKSATVARALESHVLASVPKTPKSILSDNGPEFRGSPFRKLLARYGIKQEFSVPYAPVTNGGIERFNQTLKTKLRTVCHDNTRHWDRHLHSVVAQYNRTPHSETNKAPADFFVRDSEINIPDKPRFWRNPSNFKSFQVGDLIMRKTPYQPAGQHDKLAPKFQGPLRIVSVDPNEVTYRAQWLYGKKKLVTLHISQIKPFHGQLPLPPTVTSNPGVPRRFIESPVPVSPPVDIFSLNLDALKHIPCPPEVVSRYVSPIPIDWGGDDESNVSDIELVPLDWDDDCGTSVGSLLAQDIISENCLDNDMSENVVGIVSDECVPHIAASTPVRRMSHRNFNRELPSIRFELPSSEDSFEGFAPDLFDASHQGPSDIRDEDEYEYDQEMELDYDGTAFLCDSEIPMEGLCLSTSRMQEYYSLGVIDVPERSEDSSDLCRRQKGCLNCCLC